MLLSFRYFERLSSPCRASMLSKAEGVDFISLVASLQAKRVSAMKMPMSNLKSEREEIRLCSDGVRDAFPTHATHFKTFRAAVRRKLATSYHVDDSLFMQRFLFIPKHPDPCAIYFGDLATIFCSRYRIFPCVFCERERGQSDSGS